MAPTTGLKRATNAKLSEPCIVVCPPERHICVEFQEIYAILRAQVGLAAWGGGTGCSRGEGGRVAAAGGGDAWVACRAGDAGDGVVGGRVQVGWCGAGARQGRAVTVTRGRYRSASRWGVCCDVATPSAAPHGGTRHPCGCEEAPAAGRARRGGALSVLLAFWHCPCTLLHPGRPIPKRRPRAPEGNAPAVRPRWQARSGRAQTMNNNK